MLDSSIVSVRLVTGAPNSPPPGAVGGRDAKESSTLILARGTAAVPPCPSSTFSKALAVVELWCESSASFGVMGAQKACRDSDR